MMFSIPERYDPIILLGVLREKLPEWSIQKIRKEFNRAVLRNHETLDAYYALKATVTNKDVYMEQSGFKFTVKTENGLRQTGQGPEILFDEKTRRVYDSSVQFYGLPKGVSQSIADISKILESSGFRIPSADLPLWAGQSISYDILWALDEMYSIDLNVWTKKRSSTLDRFIYSNIYLGDNVGPSVCLHYQPETDTFFHIENQSEYFKTLFVCRKESNCDFRFKSEKLRNEHERRCGEKSVKVIQKILGSNDELITRAEDRGLIPKCTPNKNFAFYDCETVLPKSDVRTQKTSVLTTHRLVSIAVNT